MLRAYGFTGTDALCVIGVLCGWDIVGQYADLLIEAVVGIGFCDRFIFSVSRSTDTQRIAVGIVGVGGGNRCAVFGFVLWQQAVVVVVTGQFCAFYIVYINTQNCPLPFRVY